MPVVGQHLEIVADQFAVRGVGVRDIDGAIRQRLVCQSMLDSERHPLESVYAGQSRPAVFAFEELVADNNVQTVARREVGDRVQAKVLGQRARQRQRVGIVEAERRQQFQSKGGDRRVQVVERELRFRLQDRLRQGARVFDVDIDLPRRQGLVADQGPAEPHATLDFEPAGLEQLRRHFPEDVGLVEVLARDDDRLSGRRRRGGQGQQDATDGANHRCVSINRAT